MNRITDQEAVAHMRELSNYCASKNCGSCPFMSDNFKNNSTCIISQDNPSQMSYKETTTWEVLK